MLKRIICLLLTFTMAFGSFAVMTETAKAEDMSEKAVFDESEDSSETAISTEHDFEAENTEEVLPISPEEAEVDSCEERETETELAEDYFAAATTDGFEYSISNNAVTITGYSGTATEIVIPDEIEGCPVTAIGNNTFRNKNALTNIEFPSTVKSIGQTAFFGCSSLADISFPKSLTSIGQQAFYACRSLTEVVFPNQLTTTGSNAFGECSSLEKVFIPKSLTSINTYIFQNCSKLNTVEFEEGITAIPANLFRECTGLTSITIPDTVTSIGRDAFYYCRALREIELPSGLKSIGQTAFFGCSSLADISFPKSLTSIGQQAFYACRFLTEVVFPNQLTTTGSNAFGECSSLEKVFIPKSLTSVSTSGIFQNCSKLNTVEFEEGITAIPANLFRECTGLTSITIPDTVTSIGRDAFHYCRALREIELPSGLKSIGQTAFFGCSSLADISFPKSLTSIGKQAFDGCTSLTEIILPTDLTTISEYAFKGCTLLERVFIPKSLTSVSTSGIFQNCSKLNTVEFEEGITAIPANLFRECTGLTSITIPDTVTSIGQYVFYCCRALREIELPNGLTSIGNYAFMSCTSLADISFPKSLTSIGKQAFDGCTSLTEIILPTDLTTISEYAFKGCTLLERVFIPKSLTSVSTSGIFQNCSKLNTVEFEEGITAIPANLFRECTGLTSITIPDTVTSIGQYAFYNCTSLASVVLPDTLTRIEAYTFYGCTALSGIELPEELSFLGACAFKESGLERIVIPKSLATCGAADVGGWSTTIYHGPFANCSKLKTLEFEEGHTIVPTYLFAGCTGIERVELPESIMQVRWYAFSRCTNLKTIVIGNNVTEIQQNAFEYCTALTSITIPGSVVNIGDNAFRGLNESCTITYDCLVLSVGNNAIELDSGATKWFKYSCDNPGTYRMRAGIGKISVYSYDSKFNVQSQSPAYADYLGFAMDTLTEGQTIYYKLINTTSERKTFNVSLLKQSEAEAISIDQGDECIGHIGDQTTLTASFSPEFIISQSYSWSSSDESIATVNSNGVVNFVSIGEADITVTSEKGLTDTCRIKVLDYDSFSVGETKTATISQAGKYVYYYFTPEKDGKYFFYSSSNMDTYGYIYDANKIQLAYNDDGGEGNNFRITYNMTAGTKYILGARFYSSSTTGTFSVVLKKNNATSISVSGRSSGYVSDSFYLSYSLSPSSADPETVTWQTSNENVATVDSNGQVTLVSEGTVEITAVSENGLTAVKSITVNDYEYISTGETKTAAISQSGQRAYFNFIPDEDGTYVFSSPRIYTEGSISDSNRNLLTSDADYNGTKGFGITYKMTAGTKYILGVGYSNGNRTGSFYVTMTKKPDASAISIIGQSEGFAGDVFNYSVDYEPFDAVTEEITWSVNDESIATIDDNGQVLLTSVGTVTISALSENGLTATKILTVKEVETLTDGQSKSTQLTGVDSKAKFKFTPEATGTYFFNLDGLNIYYSVEDNEGNQIIGGYGNVSEILSLQEREDYFVEVDVDYDTDSEYSPETISVSFARQREQGNFNYIVLNGEAVITGYTGDETAISLPDTVDNYLVKRIGAEAFKGSSELVSVSIPEGVTSIGAYAFEQCFSLESVAIPNSVSIIDFGAFYKCDALSSISLPNNLAKIDNRVFAYCSSLVEISIPASVTTIGNDAFGGCESLATVSFANGITKIGYDAFSGCISLVDINLPESVIEIRDGAFSNCCSLTSIELPENLKHIEADTFMGCENLEDLLIPNGVLSIGENAFEGCSALTNVVVPNSVTSIGLGAFENCTNIESISLPFVGSRRDGTGRTNFGYIFGTTDNYLQYEYVPGSLKEVVVTGNVGIGKEAFVYCYGLQSIALSDSVTSIGRDVFYECGSLEEIIIGKGVISIAGGWLFGGCDSLSSVVIDEENAVYHSSGNCIIETATETLIAGCISSIIPDDGSVTRIGSSSFYDCGNISVVIPDSVTSIGSAVFGAMRNCLKKIIFKGDAPEIDAYAFRDSYNVVAFYPASNETYTEEVKQNYGGDIRWVEFAPLAIALNETATATIDNGDEIAYFSFIPEEDGLYVFYSSSGSDTYGYIYDADVAEIASDDDEGEGYNFRVSYNMTAGVTYILGARYYGNRTGEFDVSIIYVPKVVSLEIVSLPEEPFVFIEDGVISWCDNGLKIKSFFSNGEEEIWEINNPYSYVYESEEAADVYGWTFDNYEVWFSLLKETNKYEILVEVLPGDVKTSLELTPIYIYNGVCGTNLNWQLFGNAMFIYGTGAMRSFNKTSMPWYDYLNQIEEIIIEDGVTSIGNYAFAGCANVTSVTIGSDVASIGVNAFSGCSKLETISLPASLTSVSNYAFNNCSALSLIEFNSAAAPSLGPNALANTKATAIYKSSWSGFVKDKFGGKTTWLIDHVNGSCGATKYSLDRGTLTISGTGTIRGYSKGEAPWYSMKEEVQKVVIGDGVTSIGNFAFHGCENMSELMLGSSVTSIGTSAFYGCTALDEVAFPASLTELKAYAFSNCSGLSELTFESSTAPTIANTALNTVKAKAVYADNASWTEFSKSGFGGAIYWTDDPEEEIIGGSCGNQAAWILVDGTLTIYGQKGTKGYSSKTQVPWYEYRDQITKIVVEDGITSLGNYQFMGCENVTEVRLSNTLTFIGVNAFSTCSKLTSITIPATVNTINGYAFNRCSSLRTVTFEGDRPATLAGTAFANTKIKL